MKRIIQILFFLLSTVSVNGQQYAIDSLKSALHTTTADISKIKLMSMLSQHYAYNNMDSALFYGQQIIILSQKENYTYGLCDGYLCLSRALDRMGNYPDALKMALRGLQMAEQIREGKKNILLRVYNQLGTLYMLMKQFPDAKATLRKCIENVNGPNDPNYCNALILLGTVYRQENRLDSALICATQAYKISIQQDIQMQQPFVMSVLGDVYKALNRKDSAMTFYKQSIRKGEEMNNYFFTARSLNGLADLFSKMGAYDSCLFYARKSLQLAQENSFKLYVFNASSIIKNTYEKLNNTDSTLKYMRLTLATNDSLFNQVKSQQFTSMLYDEQQRQQQAKDAEERYENRVRLYALLSAMVVFVLIALFLYRNNRQKQKANVELTKALTKLKATQAQLIQKEKMASLGELTAGIAHEIQNPLNFVNNFSDVNTDLIEELEQETNKGNIAEVKLIANDIKENEKKINHHGKRADAIVKGMLQHSRVSTGKKEPTDINALADEYLRLSYYGLKAKNKDFNADFKTDFDESIGKIEVVSQDIGSVLLNLYNNAFYSVSEKKTQLNGAFEPMVSVTTKRSGNKPEIVVKDNGVGIPPKVLDKIFQPFFTTKPTGQGTGLGLSLSYDIIKAHGGELRVETKEGEGAEFIIRFQSSEYL
ncbi:MAG: hypothetical protein JWR18_197 [Segetibacter sp.]|nr:hypothetical protein [Segetibacter sp.]